MSTESGKITCEKCEYESVGLEDIARIGDPTGRVILCPLHDGEMAKKLAEALRWIKRHAGPYTEVVNALAAYDELQGRKG